MYVSTKVFHLNQTEKNIAKTLLFIAAMCKCTKIPFDLTKMNGSIISNIYNHGSRVVYNMFIFLMIINILHQNIRYTSEKTYRENIL